MEQHQFAYRANRSVEEVVSLCSAPPKEFWYNYARVIYVDFSSAFNTIVPHILYDKLLLMGVKQSL